MAKFRDLTGQTFYNWTIIKRTPNRVYYVNYGVKDGTRVHKRNQLSVICWLCRCKCGNERILLAASILAGKTKSCGCLRGDLLRPQRIKSGTAFRNLFIRYKIGAKNRGIEFNLSQEQANELFQGTCFYCGIQPSNTASAVSGELYKYNGIDRKNSNLGYDIINGVSCCEQCNRMKQTYSEKEFIEKCIAIANHQSQKTSVPISATL